MSYAIRANKRLWKFPDRPMYVWISADPGALHAELMITDNPKLAMQFAREQDAEKFCLLWSSQQIFVLADVVELVDTL